MEQTKYDVFISYSRKDYVDKNGIILNNKVSKIKEALTKAEITFWFDEEGIYSGDEFAGEIAKAIDASTVFVFVSSEASNNSTWTTGEIATAQLAGKKIIPVKIDSSRYHESLRVRLNALQYVDFTKNQEQGCEKLVCSIKTHLEKIAIIERRKKEEELRKKELERKRMEELKKQKEQEEKRLQEEQRRLVSEIKLSCNTLNNEETKIEIDRENLLLKAENVSDVGERDSLKEIIRQGGPIRRKCMEECSTLKNEIAQKNNYIEQLQDSNNRLTSEIEKLQVLIKQSEQKLLKEQKTGSNISKGLESKPDNISTIRKIGAFLTILVVGLVLGMILPKGCGSSGRDDAEITLNESSQSLNNPQSHEPVNTVETVDAITVDAIGVTFKMIRVEGGSMGIFYIGETQVTQKLWQAVMGNNPSCFKGQDHPVEWVSWDDICGKDGTGTDPNCFLYKLNHKTGMKFRLPKESEWESAAKGGNKSKNYTYAGSNDIDKVAWYWKNSGDKYLEGSDDNWDWDTIEKNNSKTHPVKQLSPNELGIYDMSGNVWEWCQDLYDSKGSRRVLRGGSWCSNARGCRVAGRDSDGPDYRGSNIGFRLALVHQ